MAQVAGPHAPVRIYKADRQSVVVNRWTDKTDPGSVWAQPMVDFLAELRQNSLHQQR